MSRDPRDVARIAELERQHEADAARIAELEAKVAELEAKIAELLALLKRNSSNSSRPPSSDGPGVGRRKLGRTGRARGGQKGHRGHERTLLPADRVVDHRPEACQRCEHPLTGDDPAPRVWQVIEIPVLKPDVTEHRAHSLTCENCGAITTETLPVEVEQHGFGARASGIVAYLTGRCRLSKRQVSEILGDVFGVPMSTGAVCAVEQDVSAALAGPADEAREVAKRQEVAHLDETGWREEKRRAWLWTMVTPLVTVFTIARSRGAKVAKELLGEGFLGRLVTDRWSAYNWVEAARRQVCWAHLIRDFTGMVERGGVGGRLAKLMLDEVGKMFEWWHRIRDGTMTHRGFQRKMKPIREEVGRLLLEAETSAEKKTAGMCKEIRKLEPALWTFVDVEGIEPTNNAAERAIRPAVLWRKGSFGTDSEAGSRFVERILTTVSTLRQHNRNVIEYLALACAQYRAHRTAPSLVPNP